MSGFSTVPVFDFSFRFKLHILLKNFKLCRMVENERSLEQRDNTTRVNQKMALMTDKRAVEEEISNYTYSLACSPDQFIREVRSLISFYQQLHRSSLCCSCAFIIPYKFESYTHWSLDELLSQAEDGLISLVVLHRSLALMCVCCNRWPAINAPFVSIQPFSNFYLK